MDPWVVLINMLHYMWHVLTEQVMVITNPIIDRLQTYLAGIEHRTAILPRKT